MSKEGYLKVEKSLYGLGFSPVELLIISQILEYQTKNMDCFISDEAMANNFGVSSSTISRAVGKLKREEFIETNTKYVQKGRIRYLTVNLNKLHNKQNDVCKDNNNSTNSNLPIAEKSNCLFRNKQNESVKDKYENKNNKKENCELNPIEKKENGFISPEEEKRRSIERFKQIY